jgi:hypothetical protein
MLTEKEDSRFGQLRHMVLKFKLHKANKQNKTKMNKSNHNKRES